VTAAGGAVMGLGTLAMGAAGGPALLFAGRFAVGLGATVTFSGTLKIAAGVVSRRALRLAVGGDGDVGVLAPSSLGAAGGADGGRRAGAAPSGRGAITLAGSSRAS